MVLRWTAAERRAGRAVDDSAWRNIFCVCVCVCVCVGEMCVCVRWEGSRICQANVMVSKPIDSATMRQSRIRNFDFFVRMECDC